jgi:hypothetical protein
LLFTPLFIILERNKKPKKENKSDESNGVSENVLTFAIRDDGCASIIAPENKMNYYSE